MRILQLLSCLLFFYCFSVNANHANTLTIYTYDSFVSDWGPGPIIKKKFEDKFKIHLEFVTVDSAATLLTKVILEGSSTKADIVLGLDMNLLDEANKSNLFFKHSLEHLINIIDLPIDWESENFVPYNYGYFAFVYNNKKFTNPPNSMEELINNTDARIVIQDPRTSTPGLGLLTWIKAIYGNKAGDAWEKLNKKIISVTKGWTDAYYNIFLAGEADMVLSYTTSPAAHIMFENNYDYSAINFSEGNYITIEFAGILKSSKNKLLAKKFLRFMLTEDFQSIIPLTNIMYPVIKINDLPEAYKSLEIPKVLQIDPTIINTNKEDWIEEWLNAS
jgi:thiamine transport system substrate-binding protein